METNPEPKLKTPVSDALRAAGNWNPNWEPFATLDPDWTEKFMSMAMHPKMSGVIEPKVWEFIAIAVDASCTHMYATGVRYHIRKALALGATKEEIAAVLQGVSVLGIHANSIGAPILLEELEAASKAGTTAPADGAAIAVADSSPKSQLEES